MSGRNPRCLFVIYMYLRLARASLASLPKSGIATGNRVGPSLASGPCRLPLVPYPPMGSDVAFDASDDRAFGTPVGNAAADGFDRGGTVVDRLELGSLRMASPPRSYLLTGHLPRMSSTEMLTMLSARTAPPDLNQSSRYLQPKVPTHARYSRPRLRGHSRGGSGDGQGFRVIHNLRNAGPASGAGVITVGNQAEEPWRKSLPRTAITTPSTINNRRSASPFKGSSASASPFADRPSAYPGGSAAPAEVTTVFSVELAKLERQVFRARRPPSHLKPLDLTKAAEDQHLNPWMQTPGGGGVAGWLGPGAPMRISHRTAPGGAFIPLSQRR